jgi:hypothetical protein
MASRAICRRFEADPAAARAGLYFRDAALEAGGEGLIGEGGPKDGRKDFMQVGEPFNGIGEGLLINLGVFGPDALADSAVVDSSKIKIHGDLLSNSTWVFNMKNNWLGSCLRNAW